jgi:hypothetical protein
VRSSYISVLPASNTRTLNLVVREGVRTLDLASGGLECSLLGLRAGCYMHPLGFPGGGRKVPEVVVHVGPALGAILLSNYDAARVVLLSSAPVLIGSQNEDHGRREEFRLCAAHALVPPEYP